MTNEEIQKLMEFIITQQAEITAQQAEMSIKQRQMLDIQFETIKRQNEFEIKFNNKLDALLDWQAKFSLDLEVGREEIKEIKNTLQKTNDILKETNNTLKQVTSLAIETSKRVDKLEDKKEN
jgi:hypothetical protein